VYICSRDRVMDAQCRKVRQYRHGVWLLYSHNDVSLELWPYRYIVQLLHTCSEGAERPVASTGATGVELFVATAIATDMRGFDSGGCGCTAAAAGGG